MAGGKKIRQLAHSGDSVVLHSSRREVLLLQSILYVHLRVYIFTMERLCRRPFRPMADYALARASAAAKVTAELHAQARLNGRVLDTLRLQDRRFGDPQGGSRPRQVHPAAGV